MPISTFAAIDVGSNELAMKIYEISKKNGIRELDFIRHTIELGTDTYNHGKISHELVNELCEVLIRFTDKMKEYDVTDYNACATSAIREASNSMLILDQIKLRSGLKVRIISNSEQRFLSYKAIALKEAQFEKIIQQGTAIVDVGAGSIQITLFDEESLVMTQNIKLGSLRIRELLGNIRNHTSNINHIIEEYIDNDILTFKKLFLKVNKIKNLIAIGDFLNEIVGFLKLISKEDKPLDQKAGITIDRDGFQTLYNHLSSKSIETLSKELSISKEQAGLLIPSTMIYQKLFEETQAEIMWLPGVTLCDGIAADHAEKKDRIIPSYDFTNDIIMSAKNISSRYQCDTNHTSNVANIALDIFDSMRKLHGLGKRERLLLQIAIILHDCGSYINLNHVHQNSYNIIMSTEFIGLSSIEQIIIANLVKYNTSNFPTFMEFSDKIDRDTYIRLSKLTAIFRIANAMDQSHKQKIKNIKVILKENDLIITVYTLEDITLEKGLFYKKADFFEEVYGIRPILKQKRSL